MKNNKQKNLYYPVIVHQTSNTQVVRTADTTDEWDKDDTETITTVLGVETEETTRENEMYCDIAVPFKVVSGKDYYLVFVVYSTGDSFSHEDGVVNYIDLFETREKAEKLAQIIQEHYSYCSNEQRWQDKKKKPPKGYSEFSLQYLNEEGQQMTLGVPWTGYFERLQGINVQKVHKMSKRKSGKINYLY